jgi:hypothetical protein
MGGKVPKNYWQNLSLPFPFVGQRLRFGHGYIDKAVYRQELEFSFLIEGVVDQYLKKIKVILLIP